MTKLTKQFLSTLIVLFALSCDEDSEQPQQHYELHGVAQKGPFKQGSKVTIRGLHPKDLRYTDELFETTTNDVYGSFSLNTSLKNPLVEVSVEGEYYHEILGEYHPTPIRLTSIAQIGVDGVVNVNLLTHLASDRLKYLVQYQGQSFEDAKIQAENETLLAYGINKPWHLPFHLMDLFEADTSNNVLLTATVLTLSPTNKTQSLYEMDIDHIKDSIAALKNNLVDGVATVEWIKKLDVTNLDKALTNLLKDFPDRPVTPLLNKALSSRLKADSLVKIGTYKGWTNGASGTAQDAQDKWLLWRYNETNTVGIYSVYFFTIPKPLLADRTEPIVFDIATSGISIRSTHGFDEPGGPEYRYYVSGSFTISKISHGRIYASFSVSTNPSYYTAVGSFDGVPLNLDCTIDYKFFIKSDPCY